MSEQDSQILRVLIPVEDMELAEPLIEFIGNYRWEQNAQFRVLHVINPITGVATLAGMPMPIPFTSYQEQLATGRQLVDNLVRRLDEVTSGAAEGYIEDGTPEEVIVRYAEEWEADLIMMVSHGRRGFERWLQGSVSSAVTNKAPCQVLVMRAKDRPAAA